MIGNAATWKILAHTKLAKDSKITVCGIMMLQFSNIRIQRHV